MNTSISDPGLQVAETVLVTLRANPRIDPVLAIWDWRIAVYLFLGGLTAGILCFAAGAILADKERELPFAARRYALWAPIVLSLGMTTLFLDLEYKLHVFRFYLTFQPLSPMSWGAWILVLVYPANILLILSTLRGGYPRLAGWAERVPFVPVLLNLSERHRRAIAWLSLPLGVGLGIYTGVLLSTFVARPFWNSGLLGPLFLVSGLSTAAALAVLAARQATERHWFTRVDLGLILVELTLVGLLLVGLLTRGQVQLDAAGLVLGGSYTLAFWLFFVGLGLLAPLVLELREMRGRAVPLLLAPVLVLAGGFLLRQIALDLGQISEWRHHANLYDPALLERLRSE